MITIIILFILSLSINIFFVVYLRWLLKKFVFLSENIADMMSSMTTFSEHLESLHELETFYGDATLENLIRHSKQIVREIAIYKDIYTLFSEEGSMELENIFEREEMYAAEEDDSEKE